MKKFDTRMFVTAWRQTGIKDYAGCEYLLTRAERLQIVNIKMNRMYKKIVQSIKSQIAV